MAGAPPTSRPSRSRKPAARSELFTAASFLYDIVATGDRLRAAQDFSFTPALRLDRRSALLSAIAKTGGCPTFADVGRALGFTRQYARELVLAAERAGLVEVFTDPHDRRTLQVALTSSGRRELQRIRLPASDWIFALLGGLAPEAMHTTIRVLGTIRDRLRRYEQEQKRAARR